MGPTISGDCSFSGNGGDGIHNMSGAGFKALPGSKIELNNNGRHGLSAPKDASIEIGGTLSASGNAVDGIAIGDADMASLKNILADIEKLMNTSYAEGLRDQIQPGLLEIKSDAEKSKTNPALWKKVLTGIRDAAVKEGSNAIVHEMGKLAEKGLDYFQHLLPIDSVL